MRRVEKDPTFTHRCAVHIVMKKRMKKEGIMKYTSNVLYHVNLVHYYYYYYYLYW